MVSPGDALVLAAREGDADAARDLLSSDPSLDACELDDETALVAAASRGFAPVVAALLDAGANPDRAPRPVDAAAAGDTPLLAALRALSARLGMPARENAAATMLKAMSSTP